MSDKGKRPERTTKGKIDRFGDFVDHTKKSRKKVPPTDKASSKGSQKPKSTGKGSGRTNKTVISLHKDVDDEVEDQIDRLENEFLDTQTQLKMMVIDKDALSSKIQRLEKEKEEAVSSGLADEVKSIDAQIKTCREELDTFIMDIARGQAKEFADKAKLERKKKELLRKAESEKRRIDEEAEDTDDDLSVPDYGDTVDNWQTEEPYAEQNYQQSHYGFHQNAEVCSHGSLIATGGGGTPSPIGPDNPFPYYRETSSTPTFVPRCTPQYVPHASSYGATSSSFVPPFMDNIPPTLATFQMSRPSPPIIPKVTTKIPTSVSSPATIAATTPIVSTAAKPVVTPATTTPVTPVMNVPLTSTATRAPPPIVTSAIPHTVPSATRYPTPPAPPPQYGIPRTPHPRGTPTTPFHFQTLSHSLPHVMTPQEKLIARQVQGGDLPIFSGRPEEWIRFAIAFDNSTQACQYTDDDNLPRLRKCLRKEAEKTVEFLLHSSKNVPKILENLKMRFGRPDQIIKTMTEKVRALPPVKFEKFDTVVDFGIAVNNLSEMIISMNSPEYLYSPILIDELVKKLPPTSQMEWASQEFNTPRLDAFAAWLEKFTRAACKLCPPPTYDEQPQNRGRRNPQQHRVLATEEVNAENNDKSLERKGQNQGRFRGNFPQRTCHICNNPDHRVARCPTFLKESVNGRWKLVNSNRLCMGCLNPNHSIKECRTKKKCDLDGCTYSHHQLLHSKKSENKVKAVVPANTEEQRPPEVRERVNFLRELALINLLVLPVILEGPKGVIETYMFMDHGATLSLIEESIADKLGLTGVSRQVRVAGFQAQPTTMRTRIVGFTVKSISGDFTCKLSNVKTVQDLDLRRQSVKKSLIQKWSHLQGISLETYENQKPGILIGSDNPSLLLALEHRVGGGNAPVAIRTPLGWALHGRTSWGSHEQYGYHINELPEDPLHQLVKYQFTTESFGTMPKITKPRSKDDIRAQLILDSTLKRVEGGWETGLLWRDDNVKLPQSKPRALMRLFSMEKKMDRDPEFARTYVDKIDEYLKKGFARVLSPEEAAVETDKTNYIAHFMNFNPKKPGKRRFVFDAADKIEGRSLNDHLLSGPDKLKSLPGVLLRFRQKKIGLTADIQDMFHRVKVKPDDAQAQRFLWRGMDRDKKPDVLEMGVLIFGATCSPTCAQEAKNRNAEEFSEEFPEAYDAIVNRHYVDDYLDSCDTTEEGIKLYEDIRRIQLAGGFNLCNWLSNSKQIMEHIPPELRAKTMKNLNMDCDQNCYTLMERVLGLFWKPESDTFTFSLSFVKVKVDVLNGQRSPTKREVLSLVMSIFDPLGFLCILTVKAKILLQLIWRSKIGWDDEIAGDLINIFKTWLLEMQKIPLFSLPRCYSPNFSNAEDIQLHVFGDGSQEAFGAIAYFRIVKNGKVETALVMARAKVAPLKTITIPRMELQAAVLCCRVAAYVLEEIEAKIHRTIFWSDSQTVLDWIRSDSKKFQTFVGQRVGEIQEISDFSQWRWVPTLDNVADEVTRLNSPCDFTPGSRWLTGPNFLGLDEEHWPKERRNTKPVEDFDVEKELKKAVVYHIQMVPSVIDVQKYSSWIRLIRVTGYVFRLIKWTSKQTLPKGKALLCSEVKEAQEWWLKTAQRESFAEEITALSNGETVSKSSRLRKLSPYLSKGVIRIKGRIDNAIAVPVSVRRPAILDPKHPYTQLLISHFHSLCGHHGQERILNEIRQQFYVFHLRAAVKKAQMNCQRCKNERVKPIPPEMGQLPTFRLEAHVVPFNKTGVDYFGPIDVVVKRSTVKRYGVLFTCLSTRAIHLEIANSLSTDSCILAIRRFVGRRGCPTHMYSDNGTNFHGANNELRKALEEINQDQINGECTIKGISWTFNPPAAPHMGGSWERMVRSVKTACGAVLKTKNLSDEVLHTLMVEAEHTVNSHPLTHVPCDPDDPEALTPNHFLIGRSSNLQPLGKFVDSDMYGRKQWRIVQVMADQFWKRWVREFLPTLLRREKWCQPTRPIQVDDIILEVNENLDRNKWPRGIVIKLYPGKDGVTRVVDVKMSNGNIYKRPVSRLCILDVRSDIGNKKEDK